MTVLRLLALAAVLAIAGCGDFPRPFMGNPGATARRLAVPPPPRLLVPVPGDAMLSDTGSRQFADALATALQNHEVPAVTDSPRTDDWRLIVHATMQGESVVPVFTVVDPRGVDQGKTQGAAVPTADWAAATPALLKKTAEADAPGIGTLLTHIEAALMQADPNSLYYRAPHVMVAAVTGAPGDGDFSLTAQMRDKLSHLGPIVQDTPDGADFILRGQVRVAPLPGNQERVEIQWLMFDAQKHDLGRIIQLNEIPAGTLNGFWGDVAVVVAQEAAAGAEEVIQRNSGHEKKPADAEQKPAEAKPAGPPAAGTAPAATAPASSPPPPGPPSPGSAAAPPAVVSPPPAGNGAVRK
jgi:hypothetical protein